MEVMTAFDDGHQAFHDCVFRSCIEQLCGLEPEELLQPAHMGEAYRQLWCEGWNAAYFDRPDDDLGPDPDVAYLGVY